MLYRFPAALLIVVLAAIVAVSAAPAGEFDRLLEVKGPGALEVIESPTLFRVAEMECLPCSADQFGFLLDRPRTSMVLARALDPTLDEYDVEPRPGGGWHVDDRGRLVGDMEIVESGPGRRLYYISGHWRFVLGITFRGRMVLVPEFEETAGAEGPYVDARARGYMKIDNAFIGLMARLVAFVFPGKVDARIERFAGAVRKVAEALREDPDGMYEILAGTDRVPDGELREFRAAFPGVSSGGAL